MIESYNREIQNSGGLSLEVENQIDRMERNLSGVQTEVLIVRNKLKEMMVRIIFSLFQLFIKYNIIII